MRRADHQHRALDTRARVADHDPIAIVDLTDLLRTDPASTELDDGRLSEQQDRDQHRATVPEPARTRPSRWPDRTESNERVSAVGETTAPLRQRRSRPRPARSGHSPRRERLRFRTATPSGSGDRGQRHSELERTRVCRRRRAEYRAQMEAGARPWTRLAPGCSQVRADAKRSAYPATSRCAAGTGACALRRPSSQRGSRRRSEQFATVFAGRRSPRWPA